ncbi:hypothetical protein [Luteolibacter yonseiensis]|nr:hypothetical protein [Luteolibacter yonseiensis]
MKPSLALLLSAACVCFSSCATDKNAKPDPKKNAKDEKKEEKPVDEGPKLVGKIASIPADRRFVLIQRYGEWQAEAGVILTTRGPEGRTANLRVTGEKLGEFAAADLQAGTLEKGDAVYSQHVPKPVTPAPQPVPDPEVPQTEDAPSEENIQKNN